MLQKTLEGTELKLKTKIKNNSHTSPTTSAKHDIILQLVQYARNVWSFRNEPRLQKHIDHGATFSKAIAERIIWIYSEENDYILDPFIGTGTVLEVCQTLKRNCIGIELNPHFYHDFLLPLETQQTLLPSAYKYRVYNDDCRNLLQYCTENSIQLIFTSPPYANCIQKSAKDRESRKVICYKDSHVKPYSDNQNDFGNLLYEEFLAEFESLFELFYKVLKVDGYCIILVKNFRDMENQRGYVNFAEDLATIAKQHGFFYHDLITEDQNENHKLQLNGSKRLFYTNLNTNQIVVLRKL